MNSQPTRALPRVLQVEESNMKIAQADSKHGSSAKRFIPPPIPLERPVKKSLKKDEYLTFKLRSTPSNDNSSVYEITVPFFRSGTPEEFLIFLKNLNKVILGLNITDGPGKYALARRLLDGDILAAFNNAATAEGNETNANFKTCLEKTTTHVFPKRALTIQTRFMRRFLRKPWEMTIKEFAARVVEMNGYMSQFPPFGDDQALPDDELLDLAEFAMPSTWQRTMIVQGFNPMEHSLQEFVEFCQRMEYTEAHDAKSRTKSKTESKTGNDAISHAKPSEQGNNNRKRNRNNHWCEYHQTDKHDRSECKVMQDQAKRMRGTWEASRHKYHDKPKEGNYKKKSWKDKPDKQELHAIVEEAVARAISKPKRKFEEQNAEEQNTIAELYNLNLSTDNENEFESE